MQKFYQLIGVLLLFLGSEAFGQSTVSGVVKDSDGSALPGVNVLIKGSSLGTITDMEGKFSLTVDPDATLVFSFVGFSQKEVAVSGNSTFNIELAEDATELTELVILGSRGEGRTIMETPAPIDIINVEQMAKNTPQMDLAQMLVAVAPSFNAVRSQGGDLSSHVDPPTLRGLAPNQMLLLINGKRRHTSALLNGSQTGTSANAVDMSFIPTAAVEKIEILRDGAAAQYGSDAIAGVINIRLKQGGNKLSGSFTAGGFPNTGPDLDELSPLEKELTREASGPDGLSYQLSTNYGLDFKNGGYLSLTGSYRQDQRTVRPTVLPLSRAGLYDASYLLNERTDINGVPIITNPELVAAMASGDNAMAADLQTVEGLMNARGIEQVDVATYAGQPKINLGSVMFNMAVPIGQDFEFYSFGDIGFKHLSGFSCFYRRAAQTDRSEYSLFPNGFRPQQYSNQSNIAATTGVDGKIGDYRFDFSNTFGVNNMSIGMFNTYNASLGPTSPTDIDLGTHSFKQNTTNLDISRFFPNFLNGLSIGVGAEMRMENYVIERGQEESYAAGSYGIYTAKEDNQALLGPDGFPLESGDGTPLVDGNGDPVELEYAGISRTIVKSLALNCQCFRGFGPTNEANEFRVVTGGYLDVELDVTESLLITGAIRGESYNDFGGVVTGKIAGRYKIADLVSFRGSYSKGYRAPSLQELNYSHTYTFFVNLVPFDGSVYPNNSTPARVLGIGQLQEERSTNISFGMAFKINKSFSFSIDAYKIDITDRIFSTSEFDASEAPALGPVIGSGLAAFRINGGDISTKGVEIVADYNTSVGRGVLALTYSGTFRENKFEGANVPQLNVLPSVDVEGKYVNRADIGQFETGTPSVRMNLGINYSIGKFSMMLRPNYWGKVITKAGRETELLDPVTGDPLLEGGSTVTGFADQTFSPQVTVDLGMSYTISDNLSVSVGGNNIFNTYPDILRWESRTFNLYSNYQQGSNGAYYFARLNFNF